MHARVNLHVRLCVSVCAACVTVIPTVTQGGWTHCGNWVLGLARAGLDKVWTRPRAHTRMHTPPGPRFLTGGGAMGGLRAERNAYRGTHFYAKSQKVVPTRTRKGPLRSYGCPYTRSEAEGSPRPC